jgi:hypothetical protein
MDENKTSSGTGGGIFLALFLVSGGVIGAYLGQPSMGVVAGLGAGIVAAALHWLIQRRR